MYAVVDIETTGGHYHKDRIIEIAVVVYDGLDIVEEFSTLINPLRPIGPFIQTLTGIDNTMVSEAPTFEEVANTILRFTQDKVFVAHNARFDYGFVKAEFRRLGIPFQRQQICTVNMSRSILPGYRSYSLGNLCRDLDIRVDYRHRAFGDAAATARLLGILLQQDHTGLIQQTILEHSNPPQLPSHLSPDVVNGLPEEPGLIRFLDTLGKVLFVSKGKNVREKVLQLFATNNDLLIPDELREKVMDIGHELTGNDLISSLLETLQIQHHQPQYNAIPRFRTYTYGLFTKLNDEGYTIIYIDQLKNQGTRPLLKFTSRMRAEKILNRIYSSQEIASSQKNVQTPKVYNQRVDKVISRYLYPYPNFLIVDIGRVGEERSVIWIQDEEVRGYGYFNPQFTGNHIHGILDMIKPIQETPDMRKQIIEYVRKNSKVLDIYPLDD